MAEFRMPSLGADMEYGTLVEWRVAPGDAVRHGQVVATVETQKGLFEVEVFEDGVVDALHVSPGTRAAVGSVLAMIRPAGEIVPAAGDGARPAPAHAAPAPAHRPRASPLARRVAESLHIDLATVQGTGPEGAISREDVERAAAARAAAASAAPPAGAQPVRVPPHEAVPTAGVPTAAEPKPSESPVRTPATVLAEQQTSAMRQAIAAAVSRSKREIPHYYLATDISLQRAFEWLQSENAKRNVTGRILPAALLVKAVALALTKFPDFNGFFSDGAFHASEAIHVGVAVSLRTGGLIVPALRNTDQKTIDELMHDMRDLVQRAREGGLRVSEITDATITITNLGDQGVPAVFGVIQPPQVALVGFGRVTERPWAEHGMLGIRPAVTATLAADHRVSDGHRGGLFLNEIDQRLQNPEQL
jgi:pyruvate dehydrogenase E2 component (dihydrolipoamide acetyltransferase)